MSWYKREEWHSGLTYRQVCEICKSVVIYTDKQLDFRPWYPDGYISCPTCKNNMRHNEGYAIDGLVNFNNAKIDVGKAKFCTQCGKAYGDNDKFCAECGQKR